LFVRCSTTYFILTSVSCSSTSDLPCIKAIARAKAISCWPALEDNHLSWMSWATWVLIEGGTLISSYSCCRDANTARPILSKEILSLRFDDWLRICDCSSSHGASTTISHINLSSCAAGSGNVPTRSWGFCVANTIKCSGRLYWVWPILMFHSAMACRSADWVLLGIRLISSTRMHSCITGPNTVSNSDVLGLYTSDHTISAGIKSLVPCTLPRSSHMICTNVLTANVFPVPGRPVSRAWPPASQHHMSQTNTSCWPIRTLAYCSWRSLISGCVILTPKPSPPKRGKGFSALSFQSFDFCHSWYPINPAVSNNQTNIAMRIYSAINIFWL